MSDDRETTSKRDDLARAEAVTRAASEGLIAARRFCRAGGRVAVLEEAKRSHRSAVAREQDVRTEVARR